MEGGAMNTCLHLLKETKRILSFQRVYLKFIEYFPDDLSALSRTLLRFFWTTFVETAVYINDFTPVMHSQHYKIQFFVEMHANSLSSAASQVQTVYLAEMLVSINYYLSSANIRNGRLSLVICNVFGIERVLCYKLGLNVCFAPANGPFAASGHMVQNPPCWKASCPLGHPQQSDFIKTNLHFLCFECPSA